MWESNCSLSLYEIITYSYIWNYFYENQKKGIHEDITLLYIEKKNKYAKPEMGLSYFILFKNELYWIETNTSCQVTWKYSTEN